MGEPIHRRKTRSLGYVRSRWPLLVSLTPLLWLLGGLLLSSCQIGYLVESAYEQTKLMNKRVPIEKVIADPHTTPEVKRKLELALEARRFAETRLALKPTKNYTTYVELDRPYVTYVVSAAPKDELTPHMWSYPLVGALPYRGYFQEEKAQVEKRKLEESGLDVYARGVTAYSTLGWFRDPILSSMIRGKDHYLVNTIIHETVHATLFIDGHADFNESLAAYIGNKGTELFYLEREGADSPAFRQLENEYADDRVFSEFISRELASLRDWYAEFKKLGQPPSEVQRESRFAEIKARFLEVGKSSMKTDTYSFFNDLALNNALLLSYELYLKDLSDFEKVYQSLGQDFKKLIAFCKELETKEDPKQYLADYVQRTLP